MRISDWSSDVCSSDLPASHSDRGTTQPCLVVARLLAAFAGVLACLLARVAVALHGIATVFAMALPGFLPRLAGVLPCFLAICSGAALPRVLPVGPNAIGRRACRERVCQSMKF